LVVTPSASTGTVKILLDHPWTLDLVLRRSRNTCRSDGSTKSKHLERGSAPSLNSLAPVEVAKFRNTPAFTMAGERAKIGAAVPRFGAPAGGSPARAVVAAAAAFVAASVAAAEAARSICSAAICSCICCRRASVWAAMVVSTRIVRRVLMMKA
jgi:hypothetical protein